MIELTRNDLVAIRNALGERYPIDERDQAIYRAGLAAGIERAAKEAQDYDAACAAAIRALVTAERDTPATR